MSACDLLLAVDRDDATPLHAQIERELRDAVRSGRLAPGAALPPTRALAARLGVSRGVVVEAYEQLTAEGYLTARTRDGTRVSSSVLREPPAPLSHEPPPPARYDFHPGHPDLSRFPRAAWARALRAACSAAADGDLGYGDVRGAARLREALAAHIGRVRGGVASPERIVATTGQQQATALALRALHARGVVRIALEDPGFFWHRASAAHLGLEPVPVPVDREGIDVERLDATGAGAALVTPAHQSPTGVVLSAERRTALVDWAQRRGAWILEDDYDAEYRYDREPVGALQGLAPDRVVYSGSVSKTLAPALRLGWLLVPDGLADAVLAEKTLDDLGSPALEQLALAELVERGELERHLRRMRPLYAERRAALQDALAQHMPDATLTGVRAGLHAVALLPRDVDEAALVRAALDAGVFVQGLASARFDPATGEPGLILGYGNIAAASIHRGIEALARVRTELPRGDGGGTCVPPTTPRRPRRRPGSGPRAPAAAS